MIPEDFTLRIKSQSYIDAASLVNALGQPSDISVRINRKKLELFPRGGTPVPWCNDAFYLESKPSYVFDPLFHSGCYYPQEASSMFLGEIFRQTVPGHENLKVLDLCGAPGGKSTHLSSLIGDRGFLVANEVIRQRASVLAENLTKWGLSNAIVTRNDPAAFRDLPGFFDMVLVDAPCSGEGMFRDQVAINEWSVENTRLCSERQKRILMDVWPSLKTGGLLIYSTCTFNPDENERNMKWLSQSKRAETVKLDIGRFPGIREIDYEGILGYGFYPGSIRGEGLFYSVIRKTEAETMPRKKLRMEPKFRATAEQARKGGDWTSFPVESFLNISESLYSVPSGIEDFSLLAGNLFILKPGTQVFSVKGKDILPSCELALSVFLRNQVFPSTELSLEQALNYLRKENPAMQNTPSGWVLANYMGINLGFMKNIGSRVNNYYPVEWRIKMSPPKDGKMAIINWKK
jgi:16S rRNA C967 or C1407 C5-methylase (RsmB/RsmF family)/NOL1/NOP2/fmu family ribosome biogenesis protein